MKIYSYPNPNRWAELCQRPVLNLEELFPMVKSVFEQVKTEGDKALKALSLKFDRYEAETFEVSAEELESIKLDPELKSAITLASQNIRAFHQQQTEPIVITENTPGVKCWRESRPIEKVGLYIPGGSAPLFSTVLMLGIPAQLAGCKEIVLCTPPDSEGKIHPAILYAAMLTGIRKIYKLGGIQAIAAMSLGTASIPKVYKIFGPGNQYVMAAKQLAFQFGTAIDLPAGPSEVLVIADLTARPDFIAADLLSQAEHGPDSQVILLTISTNLAEKVLQEIDLQTEKLGRKNIIRRALDKSKIIVLNTLEECLEWSNQYAPEHLILATARPETQIRKIINAGSVFLGNYSCESAGDYASGTNHTLPTNGFARAYSGVSLDSFVKKITFQEVDKIGVRNIGKAVEVMAAAEGLEAHKNAMTLRLNTL